MCIHPIDKVNYYYLAKRHIIIRSVFDVLSMGGVDHRLLGGADDNVSALQYLKERCIEEEEEEEKEEEKEEENYSFEDEEEEEDYTYML